MAENDAEGTAKPGDVVLGQWRLNIDGFGPCDGTDEHVLSASLGKRAALAAGAAAVLALVISTGQFLHFGVYAVTFCVIFGIGAGYSVRVRADMVLVRRFGFTRRVPLSEVTEVERYQYRNATSLRLLNASGKRLASISARVLNHGPSRQGTSAIGLIGPVSPGDRGLGHSLRRVSLLFQRTRLNPNRPGLMKAVDPRVSRSRLDHRRGGSEASPSSVRCCSSSPPSSWRCWSRSCGTTTPFPNASRAAPRPSPPCRRFG